jgi:prepilin peptidase CpaA
MVAAAALDWRARRIPNELIGLGLVLGLGAQWWTGGVSGLGQGLAAAGLSLVLLLGLFALRGLGGGDVKLAMLVGAWTDVPLLLHVLLFGALLTGIISAAFWCVHAIRPMQTAPRIPVAVPLAAATILTTADLLPSLLPIL